MAVQRDRGTDCYCNPQLHSHAMWNFLSDGHCSVKNLECQKKQLESSFTTEPKKVHFSKRRLSCQKWARLICFASLLTYRLQIASSSYVHRRCTKQSHLKLKKASTYKTNAHFTRNQRTINLCFNFESRSSSFQMNGSCIIHQRHFFAFSFLVIFFSPDPLSSFFSSLLSLPLFLPSFAYAAAPWACDTKNNGKEENLRRSTTV